MATYYSYQVLALHRYFLLCFLMVAASSVVTAQQLYINEIMASNARSIADSTGNYEDWFEVYNPNPVAVNIAGYYLSDNATLTKYRLPTGSSATSIPANGFLLIWASNVIVRGPLHVAFKLSASGEMLSLVRPDGTTIVDQVTFGPQRTDVSWGRKPNGSAEWLFFQWNDPDDNTSPGASNNSKTGFPSALDAPVFSQQGGFYSTDFNLSITSTDPAATIYYTLDGSDPDPASPGPNTFPYKQNYAEQPGQNNGLLQDETFQTLTYSDPIPVTDRTSTPNRVSLKASSFDSGPYYVPTSPVFKGTVVRAVAYKPGALISDIVTQTYFVAPADRYTDIPVISISTNERNLFDYNTGFYTAGGTFDNWRNTNPNEEISFCTPGNYSNKGDNWEKGGHAEFFLNGNSVLSQRIDVAINGGCSRSAPRKSLRLYGDENFSYPFFNNRPAGQYYNRLLLRNGGNDWNYTTLIDAYMQTMVRHLPFETQSNRPGAVFLNGEYWGIHTLMERYDKYYLNRNFGVNPDSVDVIKYDYGIYVADDGTLNEFNAIRDYFISSSTIDYNYVNTLLDIGSFSDYQISQIYSANSDWPQHNQQLWRKRTSQYLPNAPKGQDGRFRWMMNDMDYGLSGVSNFTYNALDRATSSSYLDLAEYTRFLSRLLEVDSYKSFFISRFADLLNTTFTADRTTSVLDSLQQVYDPLMPEHFDRWKTGTTFSVWTSNVNIVRTFVQQRPSFVRDHLRTRFGLSNNRAITLAVSDTAQGYVKINTIDILPTTVGVSPNPYPWTGIYFQDNLVRVVAKPRNGYRFLAWQQDGTTISTDTAYSFNPTADQMLTAVFGVNESFVGKPTAFTLTNCGYRFNGFNSATPTGTYPPNMHFVSMNQSEPTLLASFALADTITGPYNRTSSTRINGLGNDGISFINTGGGSTGYVATSLGGMVLALRTIGLSEASVQWTGGTVTSSPRRYNIRLRYRVGNNGPFTDLTNELNNPVEYVRNGTAGHSQVIGPVALPATLLNKPYVQLLWQYYYTGVGTSGARDQLRIDDIVISRGNCRSVASGSWHEAGTWSCGRVPSPCDDVYIDTGHTVTLSEGNATARRIFFEPAGRLQYLNASASVLLQTP